MATFEQKESQLRALIKGYGKVVIGYSGGVDSTLLLRLAQDELGRGNVLAVIADSLSLARQDYTDAVRLAESMGCEVVVVHPNELDDPAYVANTPDRCYICKHHLFEAILVIARARGVTHVLDGSNANDVQDYRPGQRAISELGVQSPLMAAGLTKEEIRLLSKRLWLRTARKPSMSCLATRVPYATPITRETLQQIERAEEALRTLGFKGCRVRHHGSAARIELAAGELARLIDDAMRATVVREIKAVGYQYVALDLQGYRTGSLNDEIITD